MEENQLEAVLEELNSETLHPELIKDNRLHFRLGDQIYCTRMPTQKELSDATEYRNQVYVKLLKKDNTATIKKLKKILKEKQDIDIDKIEKRIIDLEGELMQAYISLAKKKDGEDEAITKSKTEIDRVKKERLDLVLEKAGYLAPAIENQAQEEYLKLLTSCCTEQYIEEEGTGKYIQVWKEFDDYKNDDAKIAYVALGRLTELILNV